MSDKDIKKATRHVNQNEELIFELSSPGKKAYKLPPLDVPAVDHKKLLGQDAREDLGHMPEVSEIVIIRHFTRLSTWNWMGYVALACDIHGEARLITDLQAAIDALGPLYA